MTESEQSGYQLEVGDLVRVSYGDGKTYDAVILENYPSRTYLRSGYFICKVLPSINETTYDISNLFKASNTDKYHFEMLSECNSIKVLSRPERFENKTMKSYFYRIKINKDLYLTLCINSNNRYGWSTLTDAQQAYIEAYNNSN